MFYRVSSQGTDYLSTIRDIILYVTMSQYLINFLRSSGIRVYNEYYHHYSDRLGE